MEKDIFVTKRRDRHNNPTGTIGNSTWIGTNRAKISN